MNKVDAIGKIVGITVAFFPKEVANMLDKNGVTIDAQNYNSDELVSATIDGLVSSPSFAKEFSDFVERNK
jgi:hypothetical protein